MIAAEPSRRHRTFEYQSKFGTSITTGGVRFRLWAPHCEKVSLEFPRTQRPVEMDPAPRGWFEAEVAGAEPGDQYVFVLPDGRQVPDPASRYQPDDIEGPSEVIDPTAYQWSDVGWRGRPWHEAVLYELHVGTFTSEGTYRAAIDRLDQLAELGITALEIMPVNEFKGQWNWGYDGSLLFAPDRSYGPPDDLKALVDAAHQRGMMVILDVVYNHFGPKGNFLPLYAPLLTEKHKTPWGDAVNYDDEGAHMVRDFVIANAKYWLTEFRMDGLRLDAVHEIADEGPKHLLQEICEQVRAATDGRFIHLIAENGRNQAGWLKRGQTGTEWLFTAQWNDDFHHALHALATGDDYGIYHDFAARPELVGRMLAEGFAFQGEHMAFLKGPRGESTAELPPTAFVSFLQNHDQVGNFPSGERPKIPEQALPSLRAVHLLSPQIPMLFMGEEWGTSQKFCYFTDVGEDLAETIRESRRTEFKDLFPGTDGAIPDPVAQSTFEASKLDWSERETNSAQAQLKLTRDLLEVRAREIVPLLPLLGRGHFQVDRSLIRVGWPVRGGGQLNLLFNASDRHISAAAPPAGRVIWSNAAGVGSLVPWGLLFTVDAGEPER